MEEGGGCWGGGGSKYKLFLDIDRMIIHDDNPNQGFWGGWIEGQGRDTGQKVGWAGIQSNNSHK